MEQDEHTYRDHHSIHVKAKRQRMEVLRRIRRNQDKELKRVNNETD
jgi:hypothetical protein